MTEQRIEESRGLPRDYGVMAVIRLGFNRSIGWIGTISAIVSFASDVLKPVIRYFSVWLATFAVIGFLVVLLGTVKNWMQKQIGANLAVFFLITAVLSTSVLAVQRFSGDPPEGAIAYLVPGVQKLQATLDILNPKLNVLIDKLDVVNKSIDRLSPERSIIALHIAGDWGEDSCAQVRYSFAIKDNALSIKSEKSPTGATPYNFVGTILNAKGRSLEVRGELPSEVQGLEATFTYESNGITERLLWQDHVGNASPPVELNRCG